MGSVTEPGLQIFREPAGSEKWTTERVLSVRYWTPTLLSFRTTRYRSFRFTPGHYARLGLAAAEGSLVWRPYSLVSAAYDDYLEFLAILVPGGAFSAALGKLRAGDAISVEKPSYGFLTVDQLAAGRDLWLLATGTGLAPFMAIIKDPETYARFDRVILWHTCREVAELAYRDWITRDLPAHEFLGEDARAKLTYLPAVTREPFPRQKRITALVQSGEIFAELGRGPLDPAHDRVMICGGPRMLTDCQAMCEQAGMAMGSLGEPGQFVIEKAFVEK